MNIFLRSLVVAVAGAASMVTVVAGAGASDGPGIGMSVASDALTVPPGSWLGNVKVSVWSTAGAGQAVLSVSGPYAAVAPTILDLPAAPGTAAAVLTVSVPADAVPGSYTATVKAQMVTSPTPPVTLSPGVAVTLHITVALPDPEQAVTPGVIGPVAASGGWGSANSIWSVLNTGNVPEVVTLASDSPLISFTGNGPSVLPGRTARIRVTATAPWGTPPGEYPVTVTSTVSAFGLSRSQSFPLTLTVTAY